jgi:hypothetical protein
MATITEREAQQVEQANIAAEDRCHFGAGRRSARRPSRPRDQLLPY